MFTVTICHCSDSIIKMYSYTLCHTLLTLCVCVWWIRAEADGKKSRSITEIEQQMKRRACWPLLHPSIPLSHFFIPHLLVLISPFPPSFLSCSPFLFLSFLSPPRSLLLMTALLLFPPRLPPFFFLVPCDHKTYRNISEFQTFQPPSSSNSIHIFSFTFPTPLCSLLICQFSHLLYCTSFFLNNPCC